MPDLVALSLIAVGVLIAILGVLRLRHVSMQSLILGITGAIVGLLIGALASEPLSKLPSPFGGLLPLAVTIVVTIALMSVALNRGRSLLGTLPALKFDEHPKPANPTPATELTPEPIPAQTQLPPILVDTSVIIDGRIADIATAGFVPGRLLVPRFVLAELQNIADSDDAMRRGRGRRGLDVLNRLREMPDVEVEIIEDDVSHIKEVDAKLVALAQQFSCNVLTTDYNLNRVAQIQGVRVLNVNELSNAIRPVVLPGETLMVRVVQPGKERNQGVGYLADGTMIVVEDGDKLIGQEVATEVTRVFQTVAGKMIFAVPRGKSGPLPPVSAVPPEPSPEQGTDHKMPAPPNHTDPGPHNGRKSRSNRRRPPDSNNRPSGQRKAPQSAEDRLIAATNESSDRRPSQSP